MIIYERKDGIVKKSNKDLIIITAKGEKEIYPKQHRFVLDQIKFCLNLDEVRKEIKGERIK